MGLKFNRNTTEVLWRIDELARIVCPLIFSVMQAAYWVTYLYLYEATPEYDMTAFEGPSQEVAENL